MTTVTWQTETLEDGRETYQLHVRVERLVVERDAAGWWKWAAVDGDGEPVTGGRYLPSKDAAQITATDWLREYTRKLYEQTVGTRL